MNVYIYGDPDHVKRSSLSKKTVTNIIDRVAEGTDISVLVVAIYFLPGVHQTRGVYLRKWINSKGFRTGRGNWAFTSHYELPVTLPRQFKLIRLRLDGRQQLFPRDDTDAYGWRFHYQNSEAHLATLFAHELHHYRRFHLNLHPNQGEHSANEWALAHAQSLGYQVQATRIKIPKRRHRQSFLYSQFDPFKDFRKLKVGDRIMIKTDPHHRYTNQIALVIRPMRRNSKRLVIETPDGKQYRWPLPWLSIIHKTD